MTNAIATKGGSGWKRGPLPAGTWNWGGVQLPGMCSGFFFADFNGDHVIAIGVAAWGEKHKIGERTGADDLKLRPHEILWWNNALDLPPDAVGRAPIHEEAGKS